MKQRRETGSITSLNCIRVGRIEIGRTIQGLIKRGEVALVILLEEDLSPWLSLLQRLAAFFTASTAR